MTQDVVFAVATLGFAERERTLLRDVLRITEHCNPRFRALVRDSGSPPHIVVINADRADSIPRWEAFRRANASRGHVSAVFWSAQPPAQIWKYTLHRPAVLVDLFALLARVVSEEHAYRPSTTATNDQDMFVLSPAELPPQQAIIERTVLIPVMTLTLPQTVLEHPTVVLERPTVPEASGDLKANVAVLPHPPADTAIGTEGAAALPVNTSAEAIITAAPPATTDAEIAVIAEAPANATAVIAVIMEPPSSTMPEVVAATVAPALTATAASPVTAAPTSASSADDGAARARVPRGADRRVQSSSSESRFLVVDDSLPVRIQMKAALQGFAKTIDFAQDGEQALMLIDNCKYDVIFLDVILPGKDGYEVCRYIRAHPLQRKTPVIMLTGNSAPADRVKGKLAGCDTYLIKPVRQSVLKEVISEFIKSAAVA